MFSLFRKNHFIDLIPAGFCDIHNHVIPAIDDGSKSVENSLELITKMRDIGIEHIIATPHIMENVWENASENIQHQCAVLNKYLATKNTTPVKYAAEYMLDEHFKKLLDANDILPIYKNYILVELSYFNAPLDLFEVLFSIQVAGYKPILAHPERYNYYHQNFEFYQKLKDAGCLFQLNVLSLSKHYGENVQKTAYSLLKNDAYDCIGTDVHNTHHIQKIKELTLSKKHVELVKTVLVKNLAFTK
jgi:tyrosine-protein phosphatase YwqE